MTREQRIQHIRQLMDQHQWQDGTAGVLASEWGVSLETVQDLAIEAEQMTGIYVIDSAKTCGFVAA